jgi:hypothetical protein
VSFPLKSLAPGLRRVVNLSRGIRGRAGSKSLGEQRHIRMGCGLGFILFESICVCFAFLDLCPEEQTTIPNDQSFYRHSGRVWLRVYCKPKYTVAALHTVKKGKVAPAADRKNIEDVEAR